MNPTPPPPPTQPPLPASLRTKLTDYRRTLWSTKTREAAFAALLGLVLSYLAVFALDRVLDTPGWARLGILLAGLVVGAVVLPVQVARWVGGHRTLHSVARRIAREDLPLGDRLLGVMDLTTDAEEFRRSPELALAAIRSGERDLADRDLAHTLPRSRHRAWGGALSLGALVVVVAAAWVPAAAGNALARWLRPLSGVERFTFTRLAAHPDHLVVARFEPFRVELALAEDTDHRPTLATLRLGDGETLEAASEDGRFTFDVPALMDPSAARLSVGDFRETLALEPVDRPELRTAEAVWTLPAYLELPGEHARDVRGGSLGVVEGSTVAVAAQLTRALREARWTAGEVTVEGDRLRTEAVTLERSTDSRLTWTDVHGLAGTVPFQLDLRTRPDGVPTVTLQGLERGAILLHDQVAAFSVHANDDFGVRRVGLEWRGTGELERGYTVAEGEKLLGLGEPDAERLELEATLHPRMLGIDPQVLEVRAFALDALPGRERVYSTPVRVQVMTDDEHMIWVTRALGEWFDEAVEVRDVENELLQENEALFELTNAQLATPEVQRQLQAQSAAERMNGRRLSRLVRLGDELLAEAARNEQLNSNTLDDWAEMMAALDAIAGERMPSVADLLAQAAAAEPARPSEPAPGSAESEFPQPPEAGARRDGSKGGDGSETPPARLPDAPRVADVESSFNGPTEGADAEPQEGGAPPPPSSLTLPETVVQGGGAAADPPPPGPQAPADETPGPTKEELARALEEQRLLMEEFAKVAGEITEILANLEGSTFVKRLKALSRAETGVAQDLDATLTSSFGASDPPPASADVIAEVADVQETSARRASEVREDLGAYVQRMAAQGRDTAKFETVRKEMGDVGVTSEMSSIQALAAISRSGEAIAGAENLADELDRWAEILVGPGCAGAT